MILLNGSLGAEKPRAHDMLLSWEQHSAAVAARAIGVARSVKRACRYIGETKDRAKLYRALCHPHLDYCQAALAAPTAAANASLERAYKRTARMAVGTKRSAPAFAKLGWPSWGRRRAAARAAFVAKVWEEGEPPSLKELLPPPLAEGLEGMLPSAARRGELVEPAPRTAAGEQAFSVWAPRVVNQIINDNVFEDCSSDEEQQHSSIKGYGDYERAHFPMSSPAGGAGAAGWGRHPASRTPQPRWFSPPAAAAAPRGGGGGPTPAPAPFPPHNRLHWEGSVEVPRLQASIKTQSGHPPPWALHAIDRGGVLRMRDYAVTHVPHAVRREDIQAFRVAVIRSGAEFRLMERDALEWRAQCPHGPHDVHGAVGGGRPALGCAPPPRPPSAAGAAPPHPPHPQHPQRPKAYPVAPPPAAAAAAASLRSLWSTQGAVLDFSPPPPPPPTGYKGVYHNAAPSIGGPPPTLPPPMGDAAQLRAGMAPAGAPLPRAGEGMSPPVASPDSSPQLLIPKMEEQLRYVAGTWYSNGCGGVPAGVFEIEMAARPSTAYTWRALAEPGSRQGTGELGFSVDGVLLREGKRLKTVVVEISDCRKTVWWDDHVVWASSLEGLRDALARRDATQGGGAYPAPREGSTHRTTKEAAASCVVCPLLSIAATTGGELLTARDEMRERFMSWITPENCMLTICKWLCTAPAEGT
eukprot:gene19298-biopygen29592